MSGSRSSGFEAVPAELATVLDPAWLGAALDDVGAGERVVLVEQVGQSATLAEKVRLEVTIEQTDGQRRVVPCCVKAFFGGPGLEELLTTEACAYRDLTPTLPVRSPHAHYTGIDPATGRAIIVMDDVVALGGTFLGAHTPYPLEVVRDTLGQLARLHAATWGRREWAAEPWLASRITSMADRFPVDVLQRLLDDGRGPDLAPELRSAPLLKAAMLRTAAVAPTCVIHGDTHSGNVYLDAQGQACWLDWQITQWGHWSVDVSYHLATVLDVADRRAHESDLLRHYLAELTAAGADAPSWDSAWEAYGLGFTWGYFLWVITQVSSREVVLVHIPRIGAALADHDTFRRLGVLG